MQLRNRFFQFNKTAIMLPIAVIKIDVENWTSYNQKTNSVRKTHASEDADEIMSKLYLDLKGYDTTATRASAAVKLRLGLSGWCRPLTGNKSEKETQYPAELYEEELIYILKK